MENKKEIHIMVDIETMGIRDDATIFQIAAASFDLSSGEIGKTFNECVDIAKNEENVVDGSTIKWWLGENKELFHDLLHEGKKSSKEVLSCFRNWLMSFIQEDVSKYDIFLWGNGILFDNQKLKHQMEKHDMNYPIFFRNDRDMRTIVDLAAKKEKISEQDIKNLFEEPASVKHNALDDVMYQIQIVSYCYNKLINE